MNFNF